MDCRRGNFNINSKRIFDLLKKKSKPQTSVFCLGFYFLEGSDICNLISYYFINNNKKTVNVFIYIAVVGNFVH